MKKDTITKWYSQLLRARNSRYTLLLQKRQLLSVIARKRQKLLSKSLRMWMETNRHQDRIEDVRSMEQMHSDFNEVIGHLNKFRVQLTFTKLFSVMQGVKDRHIQSSMSKLIQYAIIKRAISSRVIE